MLKSVLEYPRSTSTIRNSYPARLRSPFSYPAMQFAALTVLAVVAVASAGSAPSDQCNTGAIQCCNSVQEANSPSVAGLFGVLGIAVKDVTGQVGVTCSPITAVGIAGNSW